MSTLEQQKTADDEVESQFPDINDDDLTLGERIADKVAAFGGSWTFIISFLAVLFGWILLNVLLVAKAFDPYPFILLNLVLSCIAALQAPVILMSQNRMQVNDRKRAIQDLAINRLAEREIRKLTDKLEDLSEQHLMLHRQLVELLEKKA